MDIFSDPRFHDDDAAGFISKACAGRMVRFVRIAAWSTMPIAIKPAGTYRCAGAGMPGQLHRTMNSPMERSHIALHKWVQAFHLLCSSKKGMSAHQLHRTLEITYRSAWFMAHRIRECMRPAALRRWAAKARLSRPMKPTTARSRRSRAYPGERQGRPYKGGSRGPADKRADRRPGRARRQRAHIPCSVADKATVRRSCARTSTAKSRLHTDESRLYYTDAGNICRARNRQAYARRIRARRRAYQYGRRLLLDLQAWHAWQLSALQREAPASLSWRNSISVTITASSSATTTATVQRLP